MTYNDKARGLGHGEAGAEICADPQGSARPAGIAGPRLCAHPPRTWTHPTRRSPGSPSCSDPELPARPKQSGVTAIMNILRSESTGSIHVALRSPHHAARGPLQLHDRTARPRRDIGGNANHTAHHDRTSHAGASPPTRVTPGSEYPVRRRVARLDQEHNAETTYHPVGTCKMGSDPMAVVDDSFACTGCKACASPMSLSCRH